jgi:hypothetical protein
MKTYKITSPTIKARGLKLQAIDRSAAERMLAAARQSDPDARIITLDTDR